MARTVSFIIPAFNEEKYIGDCIRSIKNAMNNYPNKYEIIVVDDHSTDKTVGYALKAGANVIFNFDNASDRPRVGLVNARQTGFEESQYDLLAFIDADNRLPWDWLFHGLRYFDEEEVVAVTGPLYFYDMPLWFLFTSKLFYKMAHICHKWWPMIQGGNFILRRSALQDNGGFDRSFQFYGEDTRTATQMAELGKIIYEPKMSIYSSGRRFRQGGIISTTATYIANYFYVSFFQKPITKKHTVYR